MKVLVADDISVQGLERLRAVPGLQLEVQTGLSEAELARAVADADALLVRSQSRVTEAVLAAAPRLKVVGRAGVGVDNIDVAAATRRGVIVLNAPDGNTISAAEHTFAMLLAVARMLPQAHASVAAGQWQRKAFLGVELHGKTLAVIGMGRIGTEVARRAKAFGMTVIGYDPFLTDERAETLGVTRADLYPAVAQADFVTVHTPLIKETRHLVNADLLKHMKAGVRIVNCARGGIVDERALVEALRSGHVAGAALDVFETEPFPADHPLRSCPNVVFTPHIAASTEEAQLNVAVVVAEEVAKVLTGQPFQNAVNLPSLTAERQAYLAPYLALGEQLGAFLGQLERGPIGELEITYAGDLANQDLSFVTRTILKGLLAQRHGDEVNYVNAPALAKDAGLRVREVKQAQSGVFTNVVIIAARTAERTRTVEGTLYSGIGPRIVSVDGYRIDCDLEGHMVYTEHQDKPGMIGRIGMLLGAAEVNIAAMQVGRRDSGGDAVMLLSVDKPVPFDILDAIAAIAGVRRVQAIELPAGGVTDANEHA
ncbi:MAG: phosphoglycerate dehydrogenase [Alicyclobacillus sp.]|nr:phosphoglycerate dehydrogenase [Alicyclobacillus sp.]